jgi:His-Xaa-Ser system protein HxsD
VSAEPPTAMNDSRIARLRVDLDLHSREAIFGAAYTFIDRCYVWLDKDADGRIVVELTPRAGADDSVEALSGDFANELLAQSTRAMVLGANRDLVQAIVSRALIGAGAQTDQAAPALPELEAFEAEGEPFDDPLGIAISWEQKYGKKTPGESSPGGTDREMNDRK